MHELFKLLLVVGGLMAIIAIVANPAGRILQIAESVLLAGAIAVITLVMLFVCAEVFMRYVYNAPIPGHLEGSELLMPIIVFLAISYTQATHGHVGMDLVLDAMSPMIRRIATVIMLVISTLVCAILAYFSFKQAYQLWEYDDVTMTPPYFRTWPSAAAISLGYGMIALRMYLQTLHLINPDRWLAHEPDLPHVGPTE